MNADCYQKGTWVKVSDRVPTNSGIKFTLTKNSQLGLAAYFDGEWIQFLPTFLGDVHRWCEFVNDNGQEIEFDVNLPEPELDGCA